MTVDWSAIRARYESGAEVCAVVGGGTFTITGADDDYIYFAGRLWKDALGRDTLERAVSMLERGELGPAPTQFLEGLRLDVETDPTIAPGCSRIPNMVTVVMKDLGCFAGPDRQLITGAPGTLRGGRDEVT
jgi:hypothetical protein